jgi:hypothetical protein
MGDFGDQLLIDWELRMRGDPDPCEGLCAETPTLVKDCGLNWERAECFTSQPTARDCRFFPCIEGCLEGFQSRSLLY